MVVRVPVMTVANVLFFAAVFSASVNSVYPVGVSALNFCGLNQKETFYITNWVAVKETEAGKISYWESKEPINQSAIDASNRIINWSIEFNQSIDQSIDRSVSLEHCRFLNDIPVQSNICNLSFLPIKRLFVLSAIAFRGTISGRSGTSILFKQFVDEINILLLCVFLKQTRKTHFVKKVQQISFSFLAVWNTLTSIAIVWTVKYDQIKYNNQYLGQGAQIIPRRPLHLAHNVHHARLFCIALTNGCLNKKTCKQLWINEICNRYTQRDVRKTQISSKSINRSIWRSNSRILKNTNTTKPINQSIHHRNSNGE